MGRVNGGPEYLDPGLDPVPLLDQLAQYDRLCHTSLINLGFRLVEDVAFRKEIVRMGRERLIDNHEKYVDQMYRWNPPERRTNKLEELSDFTVYDTSGPDGEEVVLPSK